MKKLSVYLTFIVFVSVLVTSCRKNDSIIIRYAHMGVKDEPQTRFAEEVAKIVNSQTDGKVEIRLYPNSQLGNISELVDGVKYGFIGMSHHDFASLSKFHSDLSIFNAPYIYRDVKHALMATNPLTSPVLSTINHDLINNTGIRILGSFYRGTRQLTTNFPVYSKEDLKGKKIRGVPFPVWMSMIRGMGAIPTPVEFSELTTALMTGLVDGQENPLSNIYASQIYEVQSHIIMTSHMHSCLTLFIHEKLWQKIEQKDQKIIHDAISTASDMAVEWITQADQEIIKALMASGMTFINEDDGLEINNIKSSVKNQISKDFPHWTKYIKDIQNIN
ncbi:MAG: TRAP transporter substrate-binding protein [bacterium]